MDQQIVSYLKAKGMNVITEDIDEKLSVWESWYRGKVDGFHNYHVYQGKTSVKRERYSLNLAARICQRWADLLLNEKVEINVADKSEDQYTQKKLDELLKSVNFRVRANNLIEMAFALGGGFLIQAWDGEKVVQRYIPQEYMYPISYDSGRLTEAAFCSNVTIKGKQYVYLETHTLDERGEYVIDNALLNSESGTISDNSHVLTEVGSAFYAENNIEQKWETRSKTPLFQMIRPNVANRDRFNSPFGTSVFSSATDILRSCDLIYDSYSKEFLLGKKRIFVKDGVTTFNFDKETGEQIEVFDPQDEVFYHLPGDDDTPPITDSNPSLRTAEHSVAMQDALNMLSQAVGFGSNGFRWDNGAVQTATGVISANSEMFRTLKKHELILEDAIVNMAKGLLFVEATAKGDARIDLNADITVNFDDSIIEDVAEQKRQALIEFNAGLIDAVQYYQDVYKMTEEQALAFRDSLYARAPMIPTEPEEE